MILQKLAYIFLAKRLISPSQEEFYGDFALQGLTAIYVYLSGVIWGASRLMRR